MPTAEAQVPTDRASRYLVQLCHHASRMGGHRMTRLPAHVNADHDMPGNVNAEWSDTHGTLTVDGGTCTLRATTDDLLLRAEAPDERTLLRLQEMITRNLTRFSRREPLTVTWHRLDAPTAAAHEEDTMPTPTEATTAPRTRRRTIILAGAGVLAVAGHVVLSATVLAAPPWASWTADAVLAIVVVKTVLIGLGYRTHHRHKARTRQPAAEPGATGRPAG